MKDLENFEISASDGHLGKVKDFYFDDDAWVVRWFVVETGTWLQSRQVLLSPVSVQRPDWTARTLPVSITRAQVRNSPGIDTDQPVSRQNEEQYFGYYGYPYYWDGAGLWGEGLYPYAMVPGFSGFGGDRIERERDLEAYLRDERARHRNDNPHLRSGKAVTGYHVQATDGDIGHIAGFLADDQSWAIRYLVIDTSNWWLGHQVLVAPPWIDGVHWSDQTVSVGLTRESIRTAPAYDPSAAWNVDTDMNLYRHHGRRSHWVRGLALETEI